MASSKNTAGENIPDIWSVLERSIAEAKTQEGSASASPKEKSKDKANDSQRKLRRTLRWLDVAGALFWIYVVLQLFAIDVTRTLLERIAPSFAWLANYRLLVVLVALPLVALFLWRWKALLGFLYVLGFPFVVLFWKLPKFFLKRRSWMGVIVFVNALALGLRSFRYNLITKSLAVIAAFTILVSDNNVMVGVSAAVIGVLFVWSVARTVRLTLKPGWFLRYQNKVIDRIVDSPIVPNLADVDKVMKGEVQTLDSTQLATVTTGISISIIVNRALYFWAYQLQRYRQARLGIVFNLLTYAWLFIGSACAISLLNLALLKVDPAQFAFTTYPSNLAMFVYGVSTFALNDGGGVSPAGDMAYVLRLLAGLFGVIVLPIFAFDLLRTWTKERDDTALKETVAGLKTSARKQEDALRERVHVDVDEAIQRLQQLGQGFAGVFAYFAQSIPPDFFDVDDQARD